VDDVIFAPLFSNLGYGPDLHYHDLYASGRTMLLKEREDG